MKYRVELAASAKADIRESARWLIGQASQAVADKWLTGLYRATGSVAQSALCRRGDDGDSLHLYSRFEGIQEGVFTRTATRGS
jgi:hypothetical protein